MPVHKFGRKPPMEYRTFYSSQNPHFIPPRPSRPPVAIKWKPSPNLQYPALIEGCDNEAWIENLWKIRAQEDLTISPGIPKVIGLQMGIEITLGSVFISLMQSLKDKRCSIQNETVLENVDNIVVILLNNSSNDVTVKAGEALCFLRYVK